MASAFAIEYSKAARRRVRRLPRTVARTIIGKIRALASDPLAANNNLTKLTRLREVDGHRLRVGDWRVLYSLDVDARLLRVAAILPRGEAYR